MDKPFLHGTFNKKTRSLKQVFQFYKQRILKTSSQ